MRPQWSSPHSPPGWVMNPFGPSQKPIYLLQCWWEHSCTAQLGSPGPAGLLLLWIYISIWFRNDCNNRGLIIRWMCWPGEPELARRGGLSVLGAQYRAYGTRVFCVVCWWGKLSGCEKDGKVVLFSPASPAAPPHSPVRTSRPPTQTLPLVGIWGLENLGIQHLEIFYLQNLLRFYDSLFAFSSYEPESSNLRVLVHKIDFSGNRCNEGENFKNSIKV